MDIEEINRILEKVIGLAIEVHRNLRPGLLESACQMCLAYEFTQASISFTMKEKIPIKYKGKNIDCAFRADFVIENVIILELKAINEILPIYKAQLMTYLKIKGIKLGLIINFNVKLLKKE